MFVPERRGVARHVVGALTTVIFLIRKRPESIWFQFSLVLAVILAVYSSMRRGVRVRLVADLHTKAMRRSGTVGTRSIVRALKRGSLQRCVAVLVTNAENARYATDVLGAKALVLPDPLPEPALDSDQAPSTAEGPDVVFVCSFAGDEPISLMVETACQLYGEYRIVFTGDASKVGASVREQLVRVAGLTGFLPDQDYWRLLWAAPCIAVLSSEQACLPCGAYESIAVGKRPIVVDDPYVRETFRDLAIFVQLTPDALACAIRRVLRNKSLDRSEARLVTEYEIRWLKHWALVQEELGSRALAGCRAH